MIRGDRFYTSDFTHELLSIFINIRLDLDMALPFQNSGEFHGLGGPGLSS
jgi:hypothetical protein